MATMPHSQVVNAAMGRCSCSLPDTRSGAKMLISATAIQIPTRPPALHAIHEPSAVTVRSFETDAPAMTRSCAEPGRGASVPGRYGRSVPGWGSTIPWS